MCVFAWEVHTLPTKNPTTNPPKTQQQNTKPPNQGGTDNHLILVDLKPAGIDGARVQSVLDEVSITLNKNSVPGDKSAMTPGGMRIGTPALTTRGFKQADFVQVAEFIDRAVKIAQDCQKQTPAPGEGELRGVLLALLLGRVFLFVGCGSKLSKRNSPSLLPKTPNLQIKPKPQTRQAQGVQGLPVRPRRRARRHQAAARRGGGLGWQLPHAGAVEEMVTD